MTTVDFKAARDAARKKLHAQTVGDSFSTAEGYENSKLIHYNDIEEHFPGSTYPVNDELIPNEGTMPICNRRTESGELRATFDDMSHTMIIGSTGSGKTQLLLTIIELITRLKIKPSFLATDAKGELLRLLGGGLVKDGYKIININFTNPEQSDYWNPLTDTFRLHQRILNYEKEIEVVEKDGKMVNRFHGKIYEDQHQLDIAIKAYIERLENEKGNKITEMSNLLCSSVKVLEKDSNWMSGAKDIIKATLHAMLEDSEPNERSFDLITEENYSIDTMLSILDSFGGKGEGYDNGYFSDRDPAVSQAYCLASKYLLIPAEITRAGFMSELYSAIKDMRDSSVRQVTSANSFDFSDLEDGKQPVAIFVSFKDETKLQYGVISLFVQRLYAALVEQMRKNDDTPRKNPFYFFLDEFGNMPVIDSFENQTSLGRGRNIWYWVVLQSYAQLYTQYGDKAAEIIKDNMNTHIYLGTNDLNTKDSFSKECGERTQISPNPVFGGCKPSEMKYDLETVRMVPISKISSLEPGECYIKRQKDKEYTILSRFERHYTCPEFKNDGEPYVFKSDFVREPGAHKYNAAAMAQNRRKKSYFDY